MKSEIGEAVYNSKCFRWSEYLNSFYPREYYALKLRELMKGTK